MKEFSIQISASVVAWYGAIVATLAFIINLIGLIHKISQDKFNVTFAVLPGMVVLPNGIHPYPKEEVFTDFKIINRGLRPVVITHVGFQMDKKKAGVYSSAIIMAPGFTGGACKLPAEIKGGDNYSVLAVQKEIVKSLDKIQFFEVTTATGKVFKKRMSRKLLAKFKK